MRDIESDWAQLASEVDGTGLAPAADLRRAADKRAHRRLAVVTGAVVVALVATGVAAFGRPGPPPIGPTNIVSPTVEETPPPSPTPTTAPTSPPASPTPPRSTSAQPPITSMANSVPEGYVTQTISAYRAGGAAEVMRRLRTELANCKTHTEGSTKYTVTIDRKPRYGDDAIHIVETPPTPTAPDNNNPSNHRILVIRVGDVVTVLSLDPWEQWTINRDHAELFGQLSVEAIEDWR